MNLTNISTLKPFGRFCVSLGMIPTSYKESMSYEEQLIWLCNYIETEVIPKYNENVETINELIVLYNQLKEYVDNYFENLDVQEEINNKLDDMAESGQLVEIITAYLQFNGVLSYNTILDMSASENLIDGSTAYTLGQTSYNDGKGGFYKVREKTLADVIDGFYIVELDVSNTLVAERMPNYYINSINSDISTINSTLTSLTDDGIIFIGDSYGVGTTNEVETITSWIDYIKSRYYPNAYKYAINAAGFTAGTTKFIDLLGTANSEITNKNAIKKIVVCGGFNDRNSLVSTIEEAIGTFVTTAKTYFPNASVYIGMIGGCSLKTATGTGYRSNTFLKSLPAYKRCINQGALYLNGTEQVLKNYSFLSTDGYHPNADGYSALADAIHQALETGSYTINEFAGFTLDTHLLGNVSRNGNVTRIDIEGYITYDSVATGKNITLGNIYDSSDLFRLINGTMAGAIPCRYHWETGDETYFGGFGYIIINDTGVCTLQNHLYTNTGDEDPEGIIRITNVNKLVIDYANATFPTDLC